MLVALAERPTSSGFAAGFELVLQCQAEPVAQKSKDRRFFRFEEGKLIPQLRVDLVFHLPEQGAFDVGRDDLGVDVALPADRRCVPETRGSSFQTRLNIFGWGRR